MVSIFSVMILCAKVLLLGSDPPRELSAWLLVMCTRSVTVTGLGRCLLPFEWALLYKPGGRKCCLSVGEKGTNPEEGKF